MYTTNPLFNPPNGPQNPPPDPNMVFKVPQLPVRPNEAALPIERFTHSIFEVTPEPVRMMSLDFDEEMEMAAIPEDCDCLVPIVKVLNVQKGTEQFAQVVKTTINPYFIDKHRIAYEMEMVAIPDGCPQIAGTDMSPQLLERFQSRMNEKRKCQECDGTGLVSTPKTAKIQPETRVMGWSCPAIEGPSTSAPPVLSSQDVLELKKKKSKKSNRPKIDNFNF